MLISINLLKINSKSIQKLLETISVEDKINTLENIIDFYLHEVSFNNRTVQ